jgi:hypothetical protein
VRRRTRGLAIGAALVAALPVYAPQLLAFPYHARAGASEVWAESPLPAAALGRVLAQRDRLVAASPLARQPEARHIFLTGGGWRWRWLALGAGGSLAITRAANEALIVNRSDLAADRMVNISPGNQPRTLSGVLAHETCHGIERRTYGLAVQWQVPNWLIEGYCDYLAQESTLSDAEAARLEATGQSHPALVYWQGRRRVAQALAANHGDVNALFAGAH